MTPPFARAWLHRALQRSEGWEAGVAIWPRRNPPMGDLTYRLTLSIWWTLPRISWNYIREKR